MQTGVRRGVVESKGRGGEGSTDRGERRAAVERCEEEGTLDPSSFGVGVRLRGWALAV